MKKRILLIEDDLDMASNVAEILVNSGHEPVHFGNAADALRSLENEFYDIVICDLNMPVMDGFEFLDKKNRMNNYKPVVILSGLKSQTFKREAFHLGVTSFIVKPFEKRELLETITQILGKESPAENSIEELNSRITNAALDTLRSHIRELFKSREKTKAALRKIIEEKDNDSVERIIDEIMEIQKGNESSIASGITRLLSFFDLAFIPLNPVKLREVRECTTAVDNELVTAVLQKDVFPNFPLHHIYVDIQPYKLPIHSRYLTMLITELSTNALKYGMEGGKTSIIGFKKNEFYQLQFFNKSDLASGSNIEKLNRVFDNFKNGGFENSSGLGLKIVFVISILSNFRVKFSSNSDGIGVGITWRL